MSVMHGSDCGVEVEELSPEQGKALLDEVARRLLDLGGDEFLTRWRDGSFEDDPRPEVFEVGMLVPFAE